MPLRKALTAWHKSSFNFSQELHPILSHKIFYLQNSVGVGVGNRKRRERERARVYEDQALMINFGGYSTLG